MRQPVKCKNCGLKWLRVVPFGGDTEMNWDVQLYCPKCGSNWFEYVDESKDEEAKQ